ncbi:hypothetical protein KJ953_01835 [Patescibacteria group bacterium]|nr:hypothetical protein [Patescibacteria group bacterium]MBU1256675.1 hypothetical protein [Patescibacteria group bacterium]MBU1457315.1 hypothetical protein [Patescibacteria group bacterium]
MNLLTESLWGDEGFSALAVQKPFIEMLGVVMRDTAPPLFYAVGYAWGRVFGFSEVSLRSLSLILMLGVGILAGKTIYEVGRNKLVAVLGGLLAFLSPFLIPFAFEWRMYALLAFTITGSVYFFVARKWTGYVIFTIMALYTHHLALFTLAGQGLWFLLSDFEWKKPKKWMRQLKPFWLIILCYLPWVYPMYLQTTRVQGGGFWLAAPSLKEVLDLMWRFITGGVVEEKRLWVRAGVLLLLIGKDWKRVGKKWVELLVIYVFPVVLSAIVSYLVTPIFYDRYLLSVVAGLVVLIVVGARDKFKWILLAMVVFYGLTSFGVFMNPKKRPFRQMAEYIKQEIGEDDVLINYNGAAHHLWESKYYGVLAPIYTPSGPLPLYVGTAQMTEEDTVESIGYVKGKLGVIASEPIENVEIEGFELTEKKDFDGLTFSWWIRNVAKN